MPFLDERGKILWCAAGNPSGDFLEGVARVHHKMVTRGVECFRRSLKWGDRGDFGSFNFGVTCGPGQGTPSQLSIPEVLEPFINELVNDKDMKRIAWYQDCQYISLRYKLHLPPFSSFLSPLGTEALPALQGPFRCGLRKIPPLPPPF